MRVVSVPNSRAPVSDGAKLYPAAPQPGSMSKTDHQRSFVYGLLAAVVVTTLACDSKPATTSTGIAPVYNQQTGKLEQLLSDRDGDGRPETRAFMDGSVLKRIEIDRDGDGKPDRWEYYAEGSTMASGRTGTGGVPMVDHIEEANGTDGKITRREHYANGVIRRVVDDVDLDGRPDKWETYEGGVLTRVELDLVGKGFASQRLTYGPDGSVLKIETDPEGDGVFVTVSSREPERD